jgi:hypothetical protein
VEEKRPTARIRLARPSAPLLQRHRDPEMKFRPGA